MIIEVQLKKNIFLRIFRFRKLCEHQLYTGHAEKTFDEKDLCIQT